MTEKLPLPKKKLFLPRRVVKFLPLPKKFLPAGETTHPAVIIAYVFLGIIAIFLFVLFGR